MVNRTTDQTTDQRAAKRRRRDQRDQRDQRGPRGQRGAALVEMAIVLPILILLTFAVIEYSWLTFRAAQVNQAARHGARIAVRPAATVEEVQAAVAAIMDGAGLAGYTLTLNPADPATAVGDPVTVNVSIDYADISLTGAAFVPVPETLAGNVTMAKEGPD